jgi:hypothetical protein
MKRSEQTDDGEVQSSMEEPNIAAQLAALSLRILNVRGSNTGSEFGYLIVLLFSPRSLQANAGSHPN